LKICLFALSNFLDVQGSTEPYYVYRHLKSRHEVIAVVPSSGERASPNQEITFIRKVKGLPTFMSYNLLLIPSLVVGPFKDAHVIYTYKGAITPVLALKFLMGKKWVCDFRTSPLAQELEFKKLQGTLTLGRRIAYSLARWFYKFTLPKCDLIVTLSQEIQEELIQEYGVPAEKIFTLPLGVDLSLFSPKGLRPSIQESGLRLVYSGAIAPQRGLDTALQALRLLKNSVPTRLVIIGRGPKATIRYLQGFAQDLGVDKLIEWKGFIPHDRVPEVLDTCHIGLSPLPRLKAYEVSSPAKVVEYLAMGLAVVATDIRAHRKVIHHEENGLLVPPGDPKALAQALERLYNDPGLLSQIASRARESAKPYSWDALIEGLERRLRGLAH